MRDPALEPHYYAILKEITSSNTLNPDGVVKHGVVLEIWKDPNDGRKEYRTNRVTSASVFKNVIDAVRGGDRAVKLFAETGFFPNLCEPF